MGNRQPRAESTERRQRRIKQSLGLLLVLSCVPTAPVRAQTPQPSRPAGKLVPRPLYRDPSFDAPTDPVLCFNAEQGKWFMYYTARRATATDAPGVSWIHGTNIGMAESSDDGVQRGRIAALQI
jgi:hypothetical protein